MTLQELDAARWTSLAKLTAAVQAYTAVMDAGHEDNTHELAGWLEKLEADYVAAHQRREALLESGYDAEETVAA